MRITLTQYSKLSPKIRHLIMVIDDASFEIPHVPHESDTVVLARDGRGTIAGFLLVTVRGFVERVAVLEKFRGKGIQRKMIRRVKRKFNKLRTYTLRDTVGRISAWNFIECGFRYVRKSKDVFCLVWRKNPRTTRVRSKL